MGEEEEECTGGKGRMGKEAGPLFAPYCSTSMQPNMNFLRPSTNIPGIAEEKRGGVGGKARNKTERGVRYGVGHGCGNAQVWVHAV